MDHVSSQLIRCFFAGSLAREDSAELVRHLLRCPECRELARVVFFDHPLSHPFRTRRQVAA
jgi:hypothetical protein